MNHIYQCTIILFINGNKIQEIKNLNIDKNIELKKNSWENFCKNSQQICELTILLKIKYLENDYFNISINSEEVEEEENISKEGNNNIFIILLCALFSIIILLILFILLFLKCRNKNKAENEINNLSKEKEFKLI